MAASILFKFGTYVFGLNEGEDVEDIQDSAPMRLSAAEVAKRHGVVIGDFPVADARQITIKGTIYGTSDENARTLWMAMVKALKGQGEAQLRYQDDRYINAYCEHVDRFWIEGSSMSAIRFNAIFICADPFFYEAAVQHGPTIWTSPTFNSFSILGTAPVFPVITVTSPSSASDTIFQNRTYSTKEKMWWKRNFLQSFTTLIFDCANFKLTRNGNKADSEFRGTYFPLLPGTNEIALLAPSTATVQINYTPRFW